MENENEQLDNVKPETSFEVQLYIYDLSRGLAQSLISQLLGGCYAIDRQFDGLRPHSLAKSLETFSLKAKIRRCLEVQKLFNLNSLPKILS